MSEKIEVCNACGGTDGLIEELDGTIHCRHCFRYDIMGKQIKKLIESVKNIEKLLFFKEDVFDDCTYFKNGMCTIGDPFVPNHSSGSCPCYDNGKKYGHNVPREPMSNWNRARMLIEIERLRERERPDYVKIYSDTKYAKLANSDEGSLKLSREGDRLEKLDSEAGKGITLPKSGTPDKIGVARIELLSILHNSLEQHEQIKQLEKDIEKLIESYDCKIDLLATENEQLKDHIKKGLQCDECGLTDICMKENEQLKEEISQLKNALVDCPCCKENEQLKSTLKELGVNYDTLDKKNQNLRDILENRVNEINETDKEVERLKSELKSEKDSHIKNVSHFKEVQEENKRLKQELAKVTK